MNYIFRTNINYTIVRNILILLFISTITVLNIAVSVLSSDPATFNNNQILIFEGICIRSDTLVISQATLNILLMILLVRFAEYIHEKKIQSIKRDLEISAYDLRSFLDCKKYEKLYTILEYFEKDIKQL